MTAVWYVTPCKLVESHEQLGGTYCPHLLHSLHVYTFHMSSLKSYHRGKSQVVYPLWIRKIN